MIELVFVIVILGILAMVAIPKLAATRDDAKAAAIKTDIGSMLQAIPAWYIGQRQISIENAMQLDTSVWTRPSDTELLYQFNDGKGTVTVKIVDSPDINATWTEADVKKSTVLSTVAGGKNSNAALNNNPWLVIDLNATGNASGADIGNNIVKMLIDDMGVKDTAIGLAGRKVQW